MPFARKLTNIDHVSLRDHIHLEEADYCGFLGEYSAGKGCAHSETNALIYNLKKGCASPPKSFVEAQIESHSGRR